MTHRLTACCVLTIALLALPGQVDSKAAAGDTFSLSGRITTDYGCAIPDVAVVVSLDANPSEVLGKATTDKDGRYSFDRLPEPKKGAFKVRIAAESPGFARAEGTMYLARNFRNMWDAGLALGRLFDPEYRVAGLVLDAQRRPVADATVSLLRPHIDGTLTQERTNAAGRFLFDNVDQAAYVVIVTRPAYDPASRLVESTPSGSKAALETFTLAPCKRCPAGRLD